MATLQFPFAVAAHDRTIQYLYQIFGGMNGVLYGVNAESSVLSEMFTTFNNVILGIAVVIVIYATIKGVLLTAHEGEMMGKQGSALWTPLKMVIGIATLVPTTAGYSAIQLIMMWIIVQGVGVADMVWNTALTHVAVGGSLQAKFTVPELDTRNVFKNLFAGLTCQATLSESLPNPGVKGTGDYYCSVNNCTAFPAYSPGQPVYALDQVGGEEKGGKVCGILTACDLDVSCSGDQGTSSLRCRVCKAQHEVLIKVLATDGTLSTAARLLEQADYSFRNFYANNNPTAGDYSGADWIKDFCKANNISPCCVPGAGAGGPNPCPTPAIDPNCTGSPDKCVYENKFAKYDPNADSQSPPDETAKILYPYAFNQPSSGPMNLVKNATELYLGALQKEVNDYIAEQAALQNIAGSAAAGKGGNTQFQNLLQYAGDTGWIMAGSFYNILARQNTNNFAAAVPAFSFQKGEFASSESYKKYRNNIQAASGLLEELAVSSTQKSGGGGSAISQRCMLSKVDSSLCGDDRPSAAIDNAVTGTATAFQDNLNSASSGDNPLVAMQLAGYILLEIAGVAFIALMAAVFIVTALLNINGWLAGSGMFAETGPAVVAAFMILIPAILLMLGFLLTVGGTFAVYIPMIPYILFTTGAIGWLLACIEAMVAGPLVALGILAPGGHHDILGKAEPALMLLFNIFMRPSLMIFGLIASGFLATVVVTMINSGFGLLITSMADLANTANSASTNATNAAGNISISQIAYDANGNPYVPGGAAALAFNPVMLIFILVVYVGIIVTAMNKCFSAIYIIPERVMTWIGGQSISYGEGEAAGELKRSTESAASGIKGGAEAAKGGIESAGKGYGKLRGKMDEVEKDATPKLKS